MNIKNKHSQPFIIVFATIILLFILSFFNTHIKWNSYQTKKVNLLSDIKSTKVLKHIPLPNFLVSDSSLIGNATTNLTLKKSTLKNTESIKSSNTNLVNFFNALNNIKSKKYKVRIAYFGDSMIEGDLISEDLRSNMQDSFGGYGVGLVPITSIVAGFRKTITHSFDGWKTYSLSNAPPLHHLLGVSGYTFVPNVITDFFEPSTNDSWVKYTSVSKKYLNQFYDVSLLFGKSVGENYVLINGSTYKLTGNKPVNELRIKSTKPYKSISATFRCTEPLDIYGFNIESDSGVFVDNFSFRGNSGLALSKVSQAIYAGTNNYLDYDLIILEYGLNVVSSEISDYHWYITGMKNVIKQLQSSFPDASVLLISVGDKSYRNNDLYETNPNVPILVAAQKKLAKEYDIGFWSLYDAMGGEGSMTKWVESDTSLANKDYTHFNNRGAHKVGNLLFDMLMKEYKNYNKNTSQ
ncbi:MAG: GDSL-type esterase/lipase family protein [Bacteroidia bacterium]